MVTFARQFLLLFLIGSASTSVLRRENIGTDSEKSYISARDDAEILAASSMVPRSTSANDNKGLEVFIRSDLEERDPTPSAVSISDNSAPLAKRIEWTSPHNRLKVAIRLQSQILEAASWTMDIWVEKTTKGYTLWRGGDFSASTNLAQVGVTCRAHGNTASDPNSQYWGNTDFTLRGVVGASEVVVTFTAKILASQTTCDVTTVITSPTCTIAGANVEITEMVLANLKG